MTITLHLGVVDQPYAVNAPRRVRVTRPRRGELLRTTAPASGAQTTGDVAQWLEDRYHVMETFYELHQQEIADEFATSMADSLVDLLAGAPPSSNIFAGIESELDTRFKQFISAQEMDGLGVPGVPTQAAKRGVNHRLKHPYAKGNPERPSFRDTGLYQASFKSWVDAA